MPMLPLPIVLSSSRLFPNTPGFPMRRRGHGGHGGDTEEIILGDTDAGISLGDTTANVVLGSTDNPASHPTEIVLGDTNAGISLGDTTANVVIGSTDN